MSGKSLLLGLLLFTAILAGCTPQTPVRWNFLVYMDGDNDLEYFAVQDFEEMERIGSSDFVNVIVLFDRTPKSEADYYTYDSTHGNWSDTRLYRVLYDGKPLEFGSERLTPEWLPDCTELDMSDPIILRQFIVYCQKSFPADRTVLTLWNHGSSVWPRSAQRTDGEEPFPTKGVCWDESSDDPYPWNCLTTDEIALALAEARSETGQRVDIINMDACLMQMMEVAYELWNNVDPLAGYVVGSEALVPGNGNDYHAALSRLTANPAMSIREFAVRLVDDYYACYAPSRYSTTYSALSLGSEFDLLVGAFTKFATVLNNAADMAEIYDTWCNTTSFMGFANECIDLYDFAEKLRRCQDRNVGKAAAGLMPAVRYAVIHHRETGWYQGRAYGLSILLPGSGIWFAHYDDPGRYASLALSTDTDWYKFILDFTAYTAP